MDEKRSRAELGMWWSDAQWRFGFGGGWPDCSGMEAFWLRCRPGHPCLQLPQGLGGRASALPDAGAGPTGRAPPTGRTRRARGEPAEEAHGRRK
jgi:hypothetical protein